MSTYSELLSKSYIERFFLSANNKYNLNLFVKRDDLIHTEISGNKLRKLKFNLDKAVANNCQRIVTYGGAYSNHLLAVAAAAKIAGISSTGFIRGDELNQDSNNVLVRCGELGMQLIFISRESFKTQKSNNKIALFDDDQTLFIPEGGANTEGVLGCCDILRDTPNDYDYIFVGQGTSTTSLGIYIAMSPKTKLVVVPVLKGYDSIKEMSKLSSMMGIDFNSSRVEVLDEFHFGGYAKSNDELEEFISNFNDLGQFKVEPVYTGKVLYGLNEFAKKLKGTKKVLFVHTGGLNHML
ncbi:MAG: pyridoxal-phosphate dependent enzyme [Crocinitomicaceae bacterium]|tara:strand:+ start:1314 stop:2198 length:885 start_codon:yes stop_codon:yes gene_type:complete